MNFPFNVRKSTQDASGVQTQWKCRGHHKDCSGVDWRDYLRVSGEEVDRSLTTWNQSPFFKFRIKP